MRLPTDYAILRAIYARYYKTFAAFQKDMPDRSAKIVVPIDVSAIAAQFRVDPDIVFGRLYYHLEEKYGYSRPNGTRVAFFALAAGEDKHCVNFPLLGSVLAGMHQERRRDLWAIWLAVISLIVSISSVVISLRHA